MAGAERVVGSSSSTLASGVLHKEDLEGRLQGTCRLLAVDEAKPRLTRAVQGLRSLDHVTVTGLALVGTCELYARSAGGSPSEGLARTFSLSGLRAQLGTNAATFDTHWRSRSFAHRPEPRTALNWLSSH